ncbi:molybdenum cofactor guanylyltransferase [Geotalea sp. SG265]|uniref:molybdenum cofactor guanylyltransferase n=1 Tax=Geotalea sp. SG265 TaxID=2922867 RepID=UPI001FAFB706|nr:molybdenum cofactor guanylyltransferase [Geotalea sp. SG265]
MAEEPSYFHTVTGIILTGGKSRRMGRDKAFLPIDGRPMVERVIRLFTASFASVLIIGGDPDRFAGYNLAHYPDIYPGCALGGLYTGLYHAETPNIFVSACDLPYPSKRVMDLLLSLRQECDTVVARTSSGLEPLFAAYGKSCLETIRLQLEAGNPCILDIFPKLNTRTISEAELANIGDTATDFCNLNTPADLERLRKQHPQT